jgi:hypothetical protein
MSRKASQETRKFTRMMIKSKAPAKPKKPNRKSGLFQRTARCELLAAFRALIIKAEIAIATNLINRKWLAGYSNYLGRTPVNQVAE